MEAGPSCCGGYFVWGEQKLQNRGQKLDFDSYFFEILSKIRELLSGRRLTHGRFDEEGDALVSSSPTGNLSSTK